MTEATELTPPVTSWCDGDVTHWPGWLSKDLADQLFAFLRAQAPLEQQTLTVYGRKIAQPRLTAWYGPGGYRYSGIETTSCPFPARLEQLRRRLATTFEAPFNSVLINLYRDGNDGVDWHADNERSLGTDPTIASLSLGATRRFQLRRRACKSEKVDLALRHGDLVLMSGQSQTAWQHRIPKTKIAVGERINLTFRNLCIPKEI